jgi:hypothetical protein
MNWPWHQPRLGVTCAALFSRPIQCGFAHNSGRDADTGYSTGLGFDCIYENQRVRYDNRVAKKVKTRFVEANLIILCKSNSLQDFADPEPLLWHGNLMSRVS